jgi:excisionase family DNA binding protein
MKVEFDCEELRPMIEMTVAEAVQRLRDEGPCDKPGRILLNKKEAAEALGVSPSTIDRLRQTAGLPSVKLDGLVLFRPEALREWAEKNERDTTCVNESNV